MLYDTSALTFLSTLSLRRATYVFAAGNKAGAISIHALLAESDLAVPHLCQWNVWISIHALLAESDDAVCNQLLFDTLISIHALLAESDSAVIKNRTAFSVFLSTLSLRRATNHGKRRTAKNQNFYPRSPCGERRALPQSSWRPKWISIHALLAESDRSKSNKTV